MSTLIATIGAASALLFGSGNDAHQTTLAELGGTADNQRLDPISCRPPALAAADPLLCRREANPAPSAS